MRQDAIERDVLRAATATTVRAPQAAMHLACVVCRETLTVTTPVSKSPRHIHSTQSVESSDVRVDVHAGVSTSDHDRTHLANNATVCNNVDTTSGDDVTVFVHDDMARCSDCDGLFHLPCLLTQQGNTTAAHHTDARAVVFTCAQCSSTSSSTAASVSLPLLVPVRALPYLGTTTSGGQSTPQMRRSSDASDCSDDADWFGAAPRVEACSRCHQFGIAASDRVVCSACGDALVHVRCCLSPALAGSAELQDVKALARKHKRPHTAKSLARSGDAVCDACAFVFDPSTRETAGRITMRAISIVPAHSTSSAGDSDDDDDASATWWRCCSQCSHSFCIDALDTDAQRDWTCMHCASATVAETDAALPTSATAPSVSASLSCPSCQQTVDGTSSSSSSGQCAACAAAITTTAGPLADTPTAPHELVTLLICDGCEGEFDFAQLVPPLAAIPSGDWFCAACAPSASLSTGEPVAAAGAVDADNVPFVDVTLLICDGCEGEFDMSALVPPLTHVPEGDWFCDPCAVARGVTTTAKPKAKSRAKGASRRDKKAKRPGKASSSAVPSLPLLGVASAAEAPPALEELVTMLICDGCDGEFDAALLQPPLKAIPLGDWFCAACEVVRGAHSAPSLSSKRRANKAPTSSRSTGINTHVYETAVAAGPDAGATEVQDGDLVDRSDVTSVRGASSKKRKRSGIGYAAKRRGKAAKKGGSSDDMETAELADVDSVDPRVSGIYIPQPVVLSSRAASEDKSSNGVTGAAAVAALVLSDDDASDQDDNAEDAVVIVCDMCLAEFNMIDAVGGSASQTAAAPPPRPWYCIACVKSLKRTRKKRQRFSKQMLLEMQIYGELLRPTAAKAYDTMAAALRGKPPRTRSELTTMFRLVGKRVGIYFKWDKHWVMGRVLSFDARHASFYHVVRFDDGVEKALPLYAFPLVIGTRTMVYVKVPTLQNQWWPGQLLRLNPMATKLLTPDAESSDVTNFRLVSIYASSDCKGKTQNVSCWVPKYLCRSMATFSPLASTDGEIEQQSGDDALAQVGSDDRAQSIARALDEARREDEVLHVAFERLVKDVCTHSDDQERVLELAEALVGREFVDSGAPDATATSTDGTHSKSALFKATAFNAKTQELVLTHGDEQLHMDVLRVSHRFFLATASAFAEIATQFANCTSIAEATSLEQTETRAALATAAGVTKPLNEQLESDSGNRATLARSCALCLLPAHAIGVDDPITDTEDEEGLVACTKCSLHFHRACCDPPCDVIPLLNRDDGSVLLDDVHAPYVCSQCVSCAGCARRDVASTDDALLQTPQWSQWRLPLQVAALCRDCVPFYEAKQFCAVCLLVLNDDDLATCVGLHSCSTCELWVHAACEPDPHSAFLACTSSTDFELDVHLELPPLPVVAEPNGADALVKDDSAAAGSALPRTELADESVADAPVKPLTPASTTGDAETETSKPARLVDEELAFGLRFKDAYDPKVLHKYECLTCRKIRMLHVIHRLRLEDKLELFKEPVTKTIAPTYFDVIKEPMDLSTMQCKVLANRYTRVNFRDIRDDFELLCLNAVTFNSKERDFLIWREAWRFYGQGQRILRQTAPKSRMKHRGGKYHDALVTAAKRQLPNNSAIGKTQVQDGSDAGDDDFGGSADGDNDDELEALDDRADAADESRAAAALDASASTGDDSDMAKTDATTAIARNSDARAATSENGTASSALPGVAATPFMNGTSAPSAFAATGAAMAADRKPLPAPSTALVLQSELGEPPMPHSAIPVFKMIQARSTAHTYAWMDMCLSCGSAGLSSEMVFCVDCGEGFHSFCIPNWDAARMAAHEHLQAFWRCVNCKMCEGCGRPGAASGPNALHFCGHCDSGFHGACLLPAIKPASGDDDDDLGDGVHASSASAHAAIYCASCVTCHECGKAQQDMTYSYDQHVCLSCSQTKQFEATLKLEKSKPLVQIWTADARKQKKDSEKCPLCKLRWDPEDEELIQCDACELWAHPQCDSLLSAEPERYRRLVDDPSALYICEVCRPNECTHLASVPNSWKCQVLIGAIQAKREQIDAKWKEARAQLEQAKQWKFWRDHTPVYLYVLRLGEECLKTLACRSVNFRANWSRFTKDHELAASGAALPEWLVHKASRYMRFKRYSRGPRAALRRQERKTNSFYSRVGVEKQKDASVIATIVSEACSAAALLACVHLLYGWRPLPKVVLHLLSSEVTRDQGHERLSDATLRLLTQEHATMTLEEEIAMIQTQYERRVGKKPVVRESSDASDTSSTGPIESGDSVVQKVSSMKAPAVTAAKAADASEPAAESIEQATTTDSVPSTQPVRPDESSTSDAKPLVKMTQVPALCGWPSTGDVVDTAPSGAADEQQTALVAAPAPDARPKFTDNRFCAFCFMIGDDLICGRLIYTDKDQWVHVNCALWSVEVYETADGVLQKCQKAKNRSRLIRCDACGVLGASIGCAVSRCQRHYHFPCAYDYGVVFLPNGETCCPKPEHIAMMSRKQKPVAAAPAAADVVESTASVTAVAASESSSADIAEVEASPSSTVEQETATVKDGDDTVHEGEGADRPVEPQETESSTGGDGDNEHKETGNALDEPVDAVSANGAIEAETEAKKVEEALEPTLDATLPPSDSSDVPAEASSSSSLTVSTTTAPVLPVVDPSPEPRRHLRSDLPVPLSDLKKLGAKSRRQKRVPCIRVGALTVQSFGHIVVGNPSFHCRDAIFPLGYRSTRIFWSARTRQTRVLYECVVTSTEIEERLKLAKHKRKRDALDTRVRARAVFKIVASDDREHPIVAFTPDAAVLELRTRIAALYEDSLCFGAVMADKNPFVTRSSWFSYGLAGAHFFGVGVPDVVSEIEQLPHAATTSISRQRIMLASRRSSAKTRRFVHGASSSGADRTDQADEQDEQPYVFTQHLPTPQQFDDALREVEQLVAAEVRARLSSGSTRTDGFEWQQSTADGDTPRSAPIRRRLNKQASRETPETLVSSSSTAAASASSSSSSGANATATSAANVAASSSASANATSGSGGGANTKSSGSGVAMDLEHLPIAMQYRELRRRPFDERLEVRKSKIHGYGLFTKETMAEGQMIVEYQGQMIAQDVADEREKWYEEKGIGSCYMFRLDDKTIIDATRVGNLARFINHSCDPKAFARVVTVEGNEKKIVIFAKRAIDAGDEVTYDYKFPIEDEAIRCDCSAPNCIGRMN